MPFQSSDRRIRTSRVLGVSVVVAIIGGLFSSWATAQPPGVVTAVPTAELIDGQYVTVDWSGYPAEGLVYLRQCVVEPKSTDDCTAGLANGITRADGTGTLNFKILTGLLDEGFSCDYRNPCSIGVFIDEKDVKTASFARLTFAFPATDCPQGVENFAAGSGASSVQRLMLTWLAKVCLDPYNLSLSYALKNSVDGRLDYISGLTDYAMTSSPMTDSELEEAEAAGRGSFAYAPVTLSGLTFIYNVFDRKTGERVTNLKLTPDLLARIFTGQIANWNDSRIKALNPDRTLPSILRAIGRADQSASTLLVTTWFDSVAKAAYEEGGPAFRGPTDLFPSTGDIDLRTGAATVAREIAAPSQDSDFTQYGFIGWVDSSYADLYGLPTVAIQNGAGEFVTATSESLTAALEVASPSVVEPFLVPNFSSTNAAAYPLLTLTATIVPTDKIAPKKAQIIRDFVEYAAGPGQDALPAGYIPLSAPLVSHAKEVAKAIPVTPRKKPSPPEDGSLAVPEEPGGFSGDSSFGSGTGTIGNVGNVGGDTETGPVEPDPVALEAEAARSFSLSDSRFILPLLAILMIVSIVLGPAMQLAARPQLVRGAWTRARALVSRPLRRR